MKYTIIINQVGIVRAGLIDRTDVKDWVLLNFLNDFIADPNCNRVVYQNYEFVRVNYNDLIWALPILSIKNKAAISRRYKKYKKLDLIMTQRTRDGSLFVAVTEKLKHIIEDKTCPSDIRKSRYVIKDIPYPGTKLSSSASVDFDTMAGIRQRRLQP